MTRTRRLLLARGPKKGALRPGMEAIRQALLTLVEHLHIQSDLYLLAAAEGTRSKRRPRSTGVEANPLPLPRQLFRNLVALLEQAQMQGELKTGLDPRRVVHWLAALWWQEICVCGPVQDRTLRERDGLETHLEQLLLALSAA